MRLPDNVFSSPYFTQSYAATRPSTRATVVTVSRRGKWSGHRHAAGEAQSLQDETPPRLLRPSALQAEDKWLTVGRQADGLSGRVKWLSLADGGRVELTG